MAQQDGIGLFNVIYTDFTEHATTTEGVPGHLISALEGVLCGSERLKDIVRKILDAAAVLGDRLHLRVKPIDLAEHVLMWVEARRTRARSRDIELKVAVPPRACSSL